MNVNGETRATQAVDAPYLEDEGRIVSVPARFGSHSPRKSTLGGIRGTSHDAYGYLKFERNAAKLVGAPLSH